jgi:ABC-type molybdate transport system ATPase subunit
MYADDDLKNLNDEDKKRQRNAIQMQMVMLESDNRKLVSEKNMLDAELRKLRMDQERIRVEHDQKKKEFDAVTYKISQNEEELKRMKKKINLL